MRPITVYSTPIYPVRFGKHWENTAHEELKTRRNRQILIEYIRHPEKAHQDVFEARKTQVEPLKVA